MSAQQLSDYKKNHNDALVIDGHNDSVHRILNGEDIGKRTEQGHLDLERMKDGGIDAAFFSVWVPPEKKSVTYLKQADNQIDALVTFAEKYKNKIKIALNGVDVKKINSNGKVAMLISMEGAHPLDGKIKNLEYFYQRGVRAIMPTWNNSTSWATSSADESNPNKKLARRGLTTTGKKIIKKMDELGIIIDVSHSGEKTFGNIMKTSINPIIASHSCVWNICKHHRNLKDDQIRAIAKSGGVVGINFAPWFLDSTFRGKEIKMRNQNKDRIDSLKKSFEGDDFSKELEIGKMLKLEYDKILPTLSQVVDHIDYVVKLVGADYAALGSDFDGIGVTPVGLKDASYYPMITKELIARGYDKKDIEKILGGNFMRVIGKVLK
jgi:membrane dipeptidase